MLIAIVVASSSRCSSCTCNCLLLFFAASAQTVIHRRSDSRLWRLLSCGKSMAGLRPLRSTVSRTPSKECFYQAPRGPHAMPDQMFARLGSLWHTHASEDPTHLRCHRRVQRRFRLSQGALRSIPFDRLAILISTPAALHRNSSLRLGDDMRDFCRRSAFVFAFVVYMVV